MSTPEFGDEREEIIADFIVETEELIERLDQELVALEDSPDDADLLNSIFRAAHTIKGTSSFLGFDRMTELTHKAENVLDKLRNHQFAVSSEIMDALLDALDGIRALLEEIRAGSFDDGDYDPSPVAARLHAIIQNDGELPDEDLAAQSTAQDHAGDPQEDSASEKKVRSHTKRIMRNLLDQAKAAGDADDGAVSAQKTSEQAGGASSSDDLDALLASAPAVKPKLTLPEDKPGASSLDDLLASAPKVTPKLSIPGETGEEKPSRAGSTGDADDLDALLASAPKVKPSIKLPEDMQAKADSDAPPVEGAERLPEGVDIDALLANAPPISPKLTIPGEGGGKPLKPHASLDDILADAPKVQPKLSLPGESQAQPSRETAQAENEASEAKSAPPEQPASTGGDDNTAIRHRGRPPSTTDRVSTRSFRKSDVRKPSGKTRKGAKASGDAPIKSVNVEQTIRVDVERLDALMNLAGELVLGRNRLSNITRQLESTHMEGEMVTELANVVANISLITGNIQMAVMKTRMLPIGKVFNRFPRMVRDLAREKKKLVDLQIIGGDTEVDKSVIEAIGDPLVHLIRNSVDHGIEAPADRKERGKPETGRVRLSAQHEGNNVLIRIEDDGNGMDPERIGAVALKRGVIEENALSRMTDKEIRLLIFQPGFSTAETITNTSGRGVGMDVVKTNVEALGGTIDIDSELGQGTRMTIKLPLTLASIQALMVRAADEIYAIGLANVVETLRMPYSHLKSVEGAEVIQLRDRVIPVVRLRKLLDCPDPDAEESDTTYIVVVGLGDQRVGLAVEHLLGQEEVVIKPLGEYLKSVPGIAGSTILGDGRVALILDVASVLEIIHDMRISLRRYAYQRPGR